jgi:tetratricopeptide (TPR) repeat protein
MTKTGEAARPHLDLEPESFVDTVQEYQKQIIIGVIVAAVAVGGFWMWRRSAEIRETRAMEAYTAAEAAFGGGNAQLAQPELERVATRWPGTTAGTQSAMLLAQVLYDQGKHADGIQRLEGALGGAPEALKAGVLSLIAGGHEAAGQSAEAAKRFEEAVEATEFTLDKDQFRMAAARNHVAAGNVAAGRTIYQAIAGREDSQYAGEASVRVGELIGK